MNAFLAFEMPFYPASLTLWDQNTITHGEKTFIENTLSITKKPSQIWLGLLSLFTPILSKHKFLDICLKKKSRNETLKDALKVKKARDFTGFVFQDRSERKKKKGEKSGIFVQRSIYIRICSQDKEIWDAHIIQ